MCSTSRVKLYVNTYVAISKACKYCRKQTAVQMGKGGTV